MSRPLIIAHRALSPGLVENARSSIAALEATGADLVELDIRLSADRVPFVTHDAFLRRTTRARGWVRLWPSPLLRRVPLRDAQQQENIPSLKEMLQSFPSNLQPALHLKDRGALNAVLRTIARHGNPSQTWLWLDRPSDIRQAHAAHPDLHCTLLRPSGWMPAHRERYVSEAMACGAFAVSLPWGVIDSDLMSLIHRQGLLAFSRFEETPSLGRMLALGIDGIITDDPLSIYRRLGIDR